MRCEWRVSKGLADTHLLDTAALGPGHPLRQAPYESLRRSSPEARRDRVATRAQRALLTASRQGLRIRAPDGWPAFAAPRTTADVAARCPHGRPRGLSARRRRRGPKGPKEGSRRLGASRSPWRPASCERMQGRLTVSPSVARRSCIYGGQPPHGALGAPLKPCRSSHMDCALPCRHFRPGCMPADFRLARQPGRIRRATRCLEDQANVCGIVLDVGFYWSADPLPIGIDQDGCYTRQLQGVGRRSVLAIPPTGAPDSLPRGAVKPVFACTCAGHLPPCAVALRSQTGLDGELARLQDRGYWREGSFATPRGRWTGCGVGAGGLRHEPVDDDCSAEDPDDWRIMNGPDHYRAGLAVAVGPSRRGCGNMAQKLCGDDPRRRLQHSTAGEQRVRSQLG